VSSGQERYDALVIGAGAGGLSAAARLAHHGYRTVVVESRDRVGGRASSVVEEGFTVNTGAIAIEYGGVLEETFTTVGAPFEIRIPTPATMFRIKRKDVDITKGGWGKLVGGITSKGAGLLSGMGQARNGALPDEQLTVKAWLDGYTKSKTLHAIFRNLCAAIFAVNADEMPAKAFLTYFIQKGAFRNFGFSPTGTLGLMQGLADAVTARGGEVWLNSEVEQLHVSDGRVTGATVARDGERVEIETDVVVSGIVTFGITRRLCNMANLTATCPELAPEGWHLYVAYGVPIPAVGDFDEQAEIDATLQDLRDNFKGFDEHARILSVRVMRGDWPAQRSIAGLDLPRETALENLWNVGDGVREYANGGIQACAESAKLVVDQVLEPVGGATL
jgi:phytoene desaturase